MVFFSFLYAPLARPSELANQRNTSKEIRWRVAKSAILQSASHSSFLSVASVFACACSLLGKQWSLCLLSSECSPYFLSLSLSVLCAAWWPLCTCRGEREQCQLEAHLIVSCRIVSHRYFKKKRRTKQRKCVTTLIRDPVSSFACVACCRHAQCGCGRLLVVPVTWIIVQCHRLSHGCASEVIKVNY